VKAIAEHTLDSLSSSETQNCGKRAKDERKPDKISAGEKEASGLKDFK
jgi:hypothetical protein